MLVLSLEAGLCLCTNLPVAFGSCSSSQSFWSARHFRLSTYTVTHKTFTRSAPEHDSFASAMEASVWAVAHRTAMGVMSICGVKNTPKTNSSVLRRVRPRWTQDICWTPRTVCLTDECISSLCFCFLSQMPSGWAYIGPQIGSKWACIDPQKHKHM